MVTKGRITLKRITILLLTLVTLTLAACSSNEGGSSAGASTAASTAEATEVEQTAAESTPQPGAGDLAGILPTEVGGLTIEYESASGEAVMGSDAAGPEALAFFEATGADVSDLSSATGGGSDETLENVISITALRVAGVDEGRLRDAFRATLESGDDPQVVTESNVAGKNVLAYGTADSEPTGFVYVKGDILFVVNGSPLSLLEEALSKFP